MKVNFRATKAKFEDACLSQRKYAKKHGFNDAVFTQVLNGTYPSMGSPAAAAVLKHLREKGFLVEEEESRAA